MLAAPKALKLKVKDLAAPVTASKADWLAGDTWLGFTPSDGSLESHNQCQGTIFSQYRNGYVIEYITEQFSKPNPGFENDPDYIEQRRNHRKLAGRLVAVHRLRQTARPLAQVIGPEDFKSLQDMWAQGGKRHRWSVAFPIIETYEIVGHPKAKDVFGDSAYHRLYQRPSATLRELTDDERDSIAELELKAVVSSNAWIGIEDEFAFAKASEISLVTQQLIDKDLRALEGISEEWKGLVKLRAAWLADKFIASRSRASSLVCDDCGFNPTDIFPRNKVNPRSLLDVHHKNPVAEGVRYTTIADFALLCPNCHRIEHARLRLLKRSVS